MFEEDAAPQGGLSRHLTRTWILFFEYLAKITTSEKEKVVAGGGGVGELKATFGIGIGEVQPIKTDITNHYICRTPGTYVECIGNCKTPAGTSPLKIDIEHAPLLEDGETHGDWLSIFPVGTCLELPAGDRENHTVIAFREGNDTIKAGDWLRINLLAGSNEESQDIEVVVRWA